MNLVLLKDGFFVMLIGMGTVFTFLSIMALAMSLNGKVLKFVNKYFPEEDETQKNSIKKNVKNDDEMVAVAIASAVSKLGYLKK